jgi:hypothetical protein
VAADLREAPCRIVTDSLNFFPEPAPADHRVRDLPAHIHAIVFDADCDSGRLESTLIDFRKFTGRQLADYYLTHGPPSFQGVFRKQAPDDRQRRIWQPTRHPEAICEERFWRQKLDYLHDNPCRKGLVRRADHWRFSSAAYFLADGAEPNDVVLSAVHF